MTGMMGVTGDERRGTVRCRALSTPSHRLRAAWGFSMFGGDRSRYVDNGRALHHRSIRKSTLREAGAAWSCLTP